MSCFKYLPRVRVNNNFAAHGQPSLLPTLLNIQVLFLPKNTTSRLQPMDGGVIACLKRKYHQFVTRKAVDQIDSGNENSLYDIDLKQAIRAIYNIWERLDPTVIRSGWINTELVDKPSE